MIGLRQRLKRLEKASRLRPCAVCGGGDRIKFAVRLGPGTDDENEGRCPACGQGGTFVIRILPPAARDRGA